MEMIDTTKFCRWMVATGLALLSLGASAEQMTRPATGVTRIVLNTSGDLVVRPGTDEKLVVDAEQKVLGVLDISINGDTMTVTTKGSYKTQKPVKFTLSIKSFRGLKTE